jgi:nickel-dependent lactate racemase
MKVKLAYGSGHLAVDFPDDRTTIIQPAHSPGLTDERAAVVAALDKPIGAKPLREWIKPGARVCISFSDITRATPNERLIPWLLDYLREVPPAQIILLNQLGTHRPNTTEELARMLTPEVTQRYRVLNHEPENPAALFEVGKMGDGTPALVNRHFVEADVRIVTGFIEPHFFAGFSGGIKGIVPGVAGLKTVISNHRAQNIGNPKASYGITEGNPLWEELRGMAVKTGPAFLLNVTLNEQRQITGVYAGDIIAAHKVGYESVRRTAMQRFDAPFDVVVTTNSGYPLDMNLYQCVKGMSAAARVVKPGGTIIMAAECREGVPGGSPMDLFLRRTKDAEEILNLLAQPGFSEPEQWQSQILALVQRKARVVFHSTLSEETVRAAHLEPCGDIAATVRELLLAAGPDARVAVLPQGPLTIAYLAA